MRNPNPLLVLINYGIWIDQCILGIGEVWYFPSKKDVFSRNNGSSSRVMNSIACCNGVWIDQWMLGIGEVW